jgi:hypothetical protein
VNGRRAKALRREAERLTVAQRPRKLLVIRRGSWGRGMVINDPATTRGRYRELKQEAKE